ncbi:hypothetical protein L207DRAFT_541634 [Hyaloscypha variabilis F]|uniref:ATP-grasp domain-containing protein n=1 Tax=Hyaloscypha variabilis (strain UAMH 11265 / GT02V1 / F) TaxID=1149755 RepID=A0A2J6S462_HYAVF|nr:hypothetical protein L207DRAFT_541634 [Hyaloscypha variabilis F]
MPLKASSHTTLHLLQNLSLILLALLFTPLVTLLTILSTLLSPLHPTTQNLTSNLQRRTNSSTFHRRTILVTGLGMSKGLTIARSFHCAGHRVIGADFEPYSIPVCGRFSRSLSSFYRVRKPTQKQGSKEYIQDLLDIVRREDVELWVSCSGVASAIEDGEAREALEHAGCRAVQFSVEITARLHDKNMFIDNTRGLGLNVPETRGVRSVEEAVEFLDGKEGERGRRYVLKFTGTDDKIRADMTLLPLTTREETRRHVAMFKPSLERPFVLQQFISGPEFCTHSIAIRGKIKAFTACESSELLMHYRAMNPGSPLFKAFLQYTEIYAEKMGEEFTGHFSIDFLADEDIGNGKGRSVDELMNKIFPIKCNPRAHTAAVLFTGKSEEVAEAYLSLLDEGSGTLGYYWIGHDLVTRVLLPILDFLRGKIGMAIVLGDWVEFLNHLLFWKDGTYEIWDPWPMWWLYVVYWPGMFWISILERNWWSRCNVSTTKLFRCS